MLATHAETTVFRRACKHALQTAVPGAFSDKAYFYGSVNVASGASSGPTVNSNVSVFPPEVTSTS